MRPSICSSSKSNEKTRGEETKSNMTEELDSKDEANSRTSRWIVLSDVVMVMMVMSKRIDVVDDNGRCDCIRRWFGDGRRWRRQNTLFPFFWMKIWNDCRRSRVDCRCSTFGLHLSSQKIDVIPQLDDLTANHFDGAFVTLNCRQQFRIDCRQRFRV